MLKNHPMDMLDWIINNKEWLFSGIGILILVFLFHVIREMFIKQREKSRETKERDRDICKRFLRCMNNELRNLIHIVERKPYKSLGEKRAKEKISLELLSDAAKELEKVSNFRKEARQIIECLESGEAIHEKADALLKLLNKIKPKLEKL